MSKTADTVRALPLTGSSVLPGVSSEDRHRDLYRRCTGTAQRLRHDDLGQQLAHPKVQVARRVAKQANPRIRYDAIVGDVLDERTARLLTDADQAIGELGYGGEQGEHMVVVENTPDCHNIVVCTLCSCYPWPVLGLPPVWYKSSPYRSRAVMDPRGVLREFGLELPEDVEVRVWDSTAEVRYLVLPERPAASESLNEEALAALVTRDAMVGVAKVKL